MKVALGLLLGLLIGAGCRAFLIPSPAPPAIVGALLVCAMTVGYVLTDRHLLRRAAAGKHRSGRAAGAPES